MSLLLLLPPSAPRRTRNDTAAQSMEEFSLFECPEDGFSILPTKGLPQTEEIEQAYFAIGRVFAKSIIDDCPIPPSIASDFLIDYLLGEEATQDRVGVGRVVKMLVDAGYGMVKGWILNGFPPDLRVQDLLDSGDDSPIGVDSWQKVVRSLFVERVSRTLHGQLDL